jgi:hypothetical protein
VRGKKEELFFSGGGGIFFFSLDCSLTKQRQDLPFFLDKKSLTNITTNNKGVFFFSSSLKRAVRLR